jgi:hypothetical protein
MKKKILHLALASFIGMSGLSFIQEASAAKIVKNHTASSIGKVKIKAGKHINHNKYSKKHKVKNNTHMRLEKVKLHPKIRADQLASEPINTIPANILNSFIENPVVLDSPVIESSGRVIAGQANDKLIFSQGDVVYVKDLGLDQAPQYMQAFKKPVPIYDPAQVQTKKILGSLVEAPIKDGERSIIAYEAEYLADLSPKTQTGKNDSYIDIKTFTISNAKREVAVGDIVIPKQKALSAIIRPHPAPKDINGLVAKIYGGQNFGSRGQVLIVNKGAKHGLNVGSVLHIVKIGQTIIDKTQDATFKNAQSVKLPNYKAGMALVFAVHANVAYAFISDSAESIAVGDKLISEYDNINE